MDKYTALIHDENFSTLTLNVSRYPKSLAYWEKLLNYIVKASAPICKSTEPQLLKLIRCTYSSMLNEFPYLENYYIDFALLEYKLGNVSMSHKIFQRGLQAFNQRSLLLWTSYLKFCNNVVSNQKQLFKKYETAEEYVGLHFFSGEFWDLYLEQISSRCTSSKKYWNVLRKILEIPLHSFSKFYALWLQRIDDIMDLKQLSQLTSKDELLKKLKIDINYSGRKGPYLQDAKKKLKKITKEMYMVVQYQVLEIYSIFESKIYINYYTSPETLVSSDEIETWIKYLDYTITLQTDSLTHLNFQRALLPLAHYDLVWIKYSKWLINSKNDLLGAKNVLLMGLKFSLKKTEIIKLLYSVICKLNEYVLLRNLLEKIESSYSDNVENVDDFEIFWDYLQFKTFCQNSLYSSRYSDSQSNGLLNKELFDKVWKRLSCKEKKSGQEILLNNLVQFYSKDTVEFVEKNIFQKIIESGWEYYLQNGMFWNCYCRLIYFDTSRSYLDKRQYIVRKIWPQIDKKFAQSVLPSLTEFCQSYFPEEMDTLEEMFTEEP
ncbi:Prp42p [Saccharomyces cerevisiae YJM1478]|uniref:U1 snRNP protein n=1 Tax=Saccharomyces cerevisiae (strain YJM789) TaxID=307796 RepID=A6ZYI8_YEAS7|nr:Prp42p [Saccharomyces cerevisiae YJM428]AJU65744.1 Prp42p [Saccharomyces cerevisiae YJM451]AJU73492.1 Prp42p [Saccharomyces cerevisiae YJM689]AJU74204.1 Prp42p [Saccharomyces cerevisiae YJM693]AJU83160.1 Prp42p [Saccharomyces cerevisiae YJM1190]AJU83869.1 Prp42p [Saccharomyces cerevisiae YJM1199]AJU84585.1 Prp42p [Saccharomyces cerevisiae YJM1202]AJU91561.1 Prp42p [Saccharomyces cerevisiae YJM1311]AJU96514.1 Prp42p [Saccharomyces cerevisiae YJM1355]AJU99330.1 Prp42p [Saccharomyces cerev